MSGNIFAIPIIDRWLLHAPLQSVSALINEAAVQILKGNNSLSELSFLIKDDSAENRLKQKDDILRPKFLGFIPTRSCNMACIYCGFETGHAPEKVLNPHDAVAAIDWMADLLKKTNEDTLNIHFFGGEPTLRWDLVEIIVHRARLVAAQNNLIPHFEISTNGILNVRQLQFLGDYFDTVVLSFDGTREFHDRNRPLNSNMGSFDQVSQTAYYLSDMPAELCFRICVTGESVTHLQKISRWFCDDFQPAIINFETLQPTTQTAAAGLNPPDPYDFADHFCRSRQILADLGVQAIYAADYCDTPHISFCPVGYDTLILSPDHRVSSCYLLKEQWQGRSLDLDVGYMTPAGDIKIDLTAIQNLRNFIFEKPRCEKCFCRWSCAGGCHVNHSYPDWQGEYNSFCIQTRIITAISILEKMNEKALADQLLTNEDYLAKFVLQQNDLLM